MSTLPIVQLILSLVPGIVSAVGIVQLAIKQHETAPQIISAVLKAVSNVSADAAPKVATLPTSAPAAPAQ